MATKQKTPGGGENRRPSKSPQGEGEQGDMEPYDLETTAAKRRCQVYSLIIWNKLLFWGRKFLVNKPEQAFLAWYLRGTDEALHPFALQSPQRGPRWPRSYNRNKVPDYLPTTAGWHNMKQLDVIAEKRMMETVADRPLHSTNQNSYFKNSGARPMTETKTNARAFSTIQAFGTALEKAAVKYQTAAKAVLDTVISGRDCFDLSVKANEAALRETMKAIFEGSGIPQVDQRVSDAMAILKAKELPADMRSNLQNAAADVRWHNKTPEQKRAAEEKAEERKRKAEENQAQGRSGGNAQADPNAKGDKAGAVQAEGQAAKTGKAEGQAVQPSKRVTIAEARKILANDIKALRHHAEDDEVAAFLDMVESAIIDQ